MNSLANINDFRHSFLNSAASELSSYAERAAGRGDTHKNNLEAFSKFEIFPQILRGIGTVDTCVRVLGRVISSPVMIAPTAWHNLYNKQAEAAASESARKFGTIYCVSSFSSQGFELLGHGSSELSHIWYQLLIHKERSIMLEYIEKAKQAGCSAIVLTVDAPDGCRMCRPGINAKKPVFGLSPMQMPLLPKYDDNPGETLEEYYQFNLSSKACSWDYIRELIAASSLPVVLKGVLTASDARRALDIGSAGIIVSNHGGRQLDSAVSTLSALERIAEEDSLSGLEIYVDGGIRTGTDILKACAFGARAVLIGRPVLYGLAVNGEQGVFDVLSILKDELSQAMLLTGCSSVVEILRESVGKKLS